MGEFLASPLVRWLSSLLPAMGEITWTTLAQVLQTTQLSHHFQRTCGKAYQFRIFSHHKHSLSFLQGVVLASTLESFDSHISVTVEVEPPDLAGRANNLAVVLASLNTFYEDR